MSVKEGVLGLLVKPVSAFCKAAVSVTVKPPRTRAALEVPNTAPRAAPPPSNTPRRSLG